MLGSLAEDVMETGLFTFYMSDNKQNYFEKTHSHQDLTEPEGLNSCSYRRKQQAHKLSSIQLGEFKENHQQIRIREEKLNKFLSNCVGAERRGKSIQKITTQHQSKRHTQPIPLLLLKQPGVENKQFVNSNDLEIRKKDYYSENRSSVLNIKHQNMESHLKFNSKAMFAKKSNAAEGESVLKIEHKYEKENENESRVANYSIVNLHIQNDSRQSRSQSDQNSNKPKEKILKTQQKNKKLTLNSKNYGGGMMQRNEMDEMIDKQNEEQLLRQKINFIDKTERLAQLYPRLIKHHSEQLCINATHLNGISIVSITPSSLLAPASLQGSYSTSQRNHDMPYFGTQFDRNHVNFLKNSIPIPPLRLPNIKISKQSKYRNYCSNETSKPISKNIYTNQISNHIYHQQEKRRNRLEQIYKNKKAQLGLELGLLIDQHRQIEEERKINEVYYSIDNRQKKALEINFGADSKERIFNGFNQRKKLLIEKINEFTDKKSKQKSEPREKQMPKSKRSKLKLKNNKIL